MITIQNSTININTDSSTINDLLNTESPVIVRNELISLLRIISEDSRFVDQTIIIPDSCEQYGFVEGEHDLPQLLYFLADMLE